MRRKSLRSPKKAENDEAVTCFISASRPQQRTDYQDSQLLIVLVDTAHCEGASKLTCCRNVESERTKRSKDMRKVVLLK